MEEDKTKKKRIVLLSNITVDLIIKKLSYKYEFFCPEGYDTWVQEVINPNSTLYKWNTDAIIILLDGMESRRWGSTEEGKERVEIWKQAVAVLVSKINTIPIFISTIDIQENQIKSLSERRIKYEFENDWYQFIQSVVEEKDNVYIFDVASRITDIGRKRFYSNKMWYMSGMPYSLEGLKNLNDEIDKLLATVFEPRKKIIVLDLDNTLWGGVVGEEGVAGIELSDHKEGQRYYDFQRQLLEMKNRGVLLAINSKNNEEDAEKAIQCHPSMLLHDDDFVSRKINWNNKVDNLLSIVQELNITEEGFIFIDDNPFEREAIKGECQHVTVPEFPDDSTELISFAEDIWFKYCQSLIVGTEDKRRTKMYQIESSRKTELSESLSLDDYIKKLEIVVNIHRMKDTETDRVVQLINKTNQFNVTTKRYTKNDIERINSHKENDIFVVYSSDKYGDDGLISVIILRRKKTDAYIDTFLMSCRVMGRKLENVIVGKIVDKYDGRILAEYIPTEKNRPVEELFDRLGFALISKNKDGEKKYELDDENYRCVEERLYKRIDFEG